MISGDRQAAKPADPIEVSNKLSTRYTLGRYFPGTVSLGPCSFGESPQPTASTMINAINVAVMSAPALERSRRKEITRARDCGVYEMCRKYTSGPDRMSRGDSLKVSRQWQRGRLYVGHVRTTIATGSRHTNRVGLERYISLSSTSDTHATTVTLAGGARPA